MNAVLPVAGGAAVVGDVPLRRRPSGDPAVFRWHPSMFLERKAAIDCAPLAPALLAELEREQPIDVEGIEHLRATGPFILAGSHPAVPLVFDDQCTVAQSVWLTAVLFARATGRPLWCFADLAFFAVPAVADRFDATYRRLGFFPGTVDNAAALLELGEVVGIWPEGRMSHPGYRLRPFFWGYARAALRANVPVVPTILLGPHERSMCVERGGRAAVLNPERPIRVPYRLIALPPVDVREFVTDEADSAGLSRFCETMRGRMQARIEQACESRPLVPLARRFEETFGEAAAALEGRLVAPDAFLGAQVDTLPATVGVTRDHFTTELRKAFLRRLIEHSRRLFRGAGGFAAYGLWDADAETVDQAGKHLLARLLEGIPQETGRVLDLQCGNGASTVAIASLLPDAEVIGIDRLGDHKSDWRARETRCRFAQMEPTQLRFSDASFDLVVCLEGGYRANTREALLAEAMRVLKPGGMLVTSDLLHHTEALKGKVGNWVGSMLEANRLAGPAEYRSLLERLGYAEVRIEDAREAAVQGYVQHFVRFVWKALQARKIEPQAAKALAARESRVGDGVSHYLLVQATKPAGALPASRRAPARRPTAKKRAATLPKVEVAGARKRILAARKAAKGKVTPTAAKKKAK